MSYDPENIFAKILRGDLPCHRVFEDETTLAFLDIMPQADGHTLVIPKTPAETLLDLPSDAAADLIQKVQRVARGVKQAMDADGITIFQLNGSAAGQTVPHIHFHVLPGSILQARTHASISADADHLTSIGESIKAAIAAESN